MNTFKIHLFIMLLITPVCSWAQSDNGLPELKPEQRTATTKNTVQKTGENVIAPNDEYKHIGRAAGNELPRTNNGTPYKRFAPMSDPANATEVSVRDSTFVRNRIALIQQKLEVQRQDILRRLKVVAESPDKDTPKMQQTQKVLEAELHELSEKKQLFEQQLKEYLQSGGFDNKNTPKPDK